jgi:hypothetical protein
MTLAGLVWAKARGRYQSARGKVNEKSRKKDGQLPP